MASDDDGQERPHRRRRHRRSSSPPEPEGNRLIAAIVVGLVVLLFAAGGWYYFSTSSPAANALAELRALPLVGAMMADNPAAEARMKAAIQEELANPTQGGGTTRPRALIADLRRQYVVPALRGADDASVVAAVAARAALAGYLQKANPPACREFAAGGIQDPDRLDGEGRRLFRNVLQALETAYRNGRASGKAMPMASRAEILDMLREAGFQKIDFDRLNAFTTLSNDIACDIELKVDQVPPKLPADKRGAFARFVLNN